MTTLPKPSDLFIGAIVQGYHLEAGRGEPVTVSGIWDHVVYACLNMGSGGFARMFEWDTRKAKHNQNRIGTIRECIEAGYVPGLKLERNAKGGYYVARE